jgi:hypothetical protein
MRTGWKLSEKNYFLLCETLWNKKLQSETVEWGWEFTTDDTENKEGGAEVEVESSPQITQIISVINYQWSMINKGWGWD